MVATNSDTNEERNNNSSSSNDNNNNNNDYHIILYRVAVSQGTILALIFFAWAAYNPERNFWDAQTRATYSCRLACPVSYQDNNLERCRSPSAQPSALQSATDLDLPCFWSLCNNSITEEYYLHFYPPYCTKQCLDVYEECEEAFILWANPVLAALALIVMGFVAKFCPNHQRRHHQSHDNHQHHNRYTNNIHTNDGDDLNDSEDRTHFDNDHNVGLATIAQITAVFLFIVWILASMARCQ
jgi:hypothetical protein